MKRPYFTPIAVLATIEEEPMDSAMSPSVDVSKAALESIQAQFLEEPENYMEQMGRDRQMQMEQILNQGPLEFVLTRNQRNLRRMEEGAQYAAQHPNTAAGRARRIGVSEEENCANLHRLQEVRAAKLLELESHSTASRKQYVNSAYTLTSFIRDCSNACASEVRERTHRMLSKAI